LIGNQQRLRGSVVADPFVIACANYYHGTVITEEGWDHSSKTLIPKQNAVKIPNVCQHFDIPCQNLEGFMRDQKWQF
jgi:hypothetical protein